MKRFVFALVALGAVATGCTMKSGGIRWVLPATVT